MFRIPNILKKSSIYFFFNSLSSAIPFVLLPILTRYLTPDSYGRLAMFNVLIMFLMPLMRFEMQNALRREYVEHKTDFNSYLSTATIFSGVMLMVFLIAWGISQTYIDGLFGLSNFWLCIILLVAFGKVQWGNFISLMQIQDRPFLCGMWGLGMTISIFSGTIYLIVVKDFDWQGRAWPTFFIHFVVLMPLTLYMYKRMFSMRWRFDKSKLKEMLTFSLPLVPVAMGTYFIMTADRIFLTNMEGLETVGLYSVAVQIAAVIVVLVSSFRPSWEVWVYRNLGDPSSNGMRKTVIAMYGYGLFLLIVAIGIVLILPFILPVIIGEAFLQSFEYMPWLISAGVMLGFYTWMAPFILYIKKTKILNYITLIIATLNCVLNYILISEVGAVGAAIATFVSYLVGFVLLLGVVIKHHKLPWLLKAAV